MTLKELSRYYILQRRITRLEHELKEIELKATSITAGLSGMPGGGRKHNQAELTMDDKIFKEDRLQRLKVQASEELHRLADWIDTIEDPMIHEIFRLRFEECLTWNGIASVIGGNTEDSVKKMCYRYLKSRQ